MQPFHQAVIPYDKFLRYDTFPKGEKKNVFDHPLSVNPPGSQYILFFLPLLSVCVYVRFYPYFLPSVSCFPVVHCCPNTVYTQGALPVYIQTLILALLDLLFLLV